MYGMVVSDLSKWSHAQLKCHNYLQIGFYVMTYMEIIFDLSRIFNVDILTPDVKSIFSNCPYIIVTLYHTQHTIYTIIVPNDV